MEYPYAKFFFLAAAVLLGFGVASRPDLPTPSRPELLAERSTERQAVDALPESVWAVCRLQAGGVSCSGTVIRVASGNTTITTARHCFGTKARDGITVKAWDHDAEGTRIAVTKQGHYRPWPGGAEDFGIVVVHGWQSRHVATVALRSAHDIGGLDVVAVGCPGGRWPPIANPGRISSTTGATTWSTCKCLSGQSGGGLFDRNTGYLIGVTNWGAGPPGSARSCGSLGLEKLNKGLDLLLTD